LIAVAQKIKCDTNSKSVNHVVNRFIWLEMLYDLLFHKCNSVDKNIRRDLIFRRRFKLQFSSSRQLVCASFIARLIELKKVLYMRLTHILMHVLM
jgi:hypothetical protein